MEPLISVIVPIYNTERFLKNCLDSICVQTYKNLEIILVDDGSTDNCAGICDAYAQNDDRIRVIHKKNQGLSRARNTGIDSAKGEYLAFIDSDDFIHERYLELLLKACREKDCEVSITAFTRMKEEHCDLAETKVPVSEKYEEVISGREANERIYDWKKWTKSVTAWGKLFHRTLFEEARFPDIKIYEDEALIYQILYQSKKVVYLEAALYFYRRNSKGIIAAKFSGRRFVMFDILQKRAQFYRDHGEKNLYDLTVEREFFTAVQYFSKIKGQAESFREFQEYARRRQKELYRYLMRRKAFTWKRKLKFTWAVCFPVVFYRYYYQ